MNLEPVPLQDGSHISSDQEVAVERNETGLATHNERQNTALDLATMPTYQQVMRKSRGLWAKEMEHNPVSFKDEVLQLKCKGGLICTTEWYSRLDV